MSQARHLFEEHNRRTQQPGTHNNDPWFHYQKVLLLDILTRLEEILEHEGVHPGTIKRVLRCMLYGSPNPADAVLRVQQQEYLTEILKRREPMPVRWNPGAEPLP